MAAWLGPFLYLCLLYSSLVCQSLLGHPAWSCALVGALAGLWFGRRAMALTGLSLALSVLISGPPLRLLWEAFYNERNVLNALNSSGYGWSDGALGLLVGWASCAAVRHLELTSQRRNACRALALALVLQFAPRAWTVTPQLLEVLDREPVLGTYSFDGQAFLKALYLYKNGTEYFLAFRTACEGDQRNWVATANGIQTPHPAIFIFWSLLPSPSYLALVLWFLIAAMMALTYVLGEKRAGPLAGLLGASLLGAAFLFPVSSLWVTLTDVWGAVGVGYSCLAFLAGWPLAAAVAMAMAAVVRIVCFPLLLSGILACLLLRRSRKEVAAWMLVTLLVGAAYALHYQHGHEQKGFSAGSLARERFQGASLEAPLQAVRFGLVFWAGRDVWCYLVLLANLSSSLRWRDEQGLFLSGGLLTMLVAFSLFGVRGWSQFYGFNLYPLLVLGFCVRIPHWVSASGEEE